MGAVGSALRFDEDSNLHHGAAAESLLGRALYGCGSVHLACRSSRLSASTVPVE